MLRKIEVKFSELSAGVGFVGAGGVYLKKMTESGVVTTGVEETPLTYFVTEGVAPNVYGAFKYASSVVGLITTERGLLCSMGLLAGKNLKAQVNFRNPMGGKLIDADEFHFELGLGICSGNGLVQWVGGWLQTSYTLLGGYAPRFRRAITSVNGTSQTFLQQVQLSEEKYQPINSLSIRLVGNNLKSSFNGIEHLEQTIVVGGDDHVVLHCKCFSKKSASIQAYPLIQYFYAQSESFSHEARKYEIAPGKMPIVPSSVDYFLPIRQLEDQGKLKRTGATEWTFVMAGETTTLYGDRVGFAKGNRIVALTNILPSEGYMTCRFLFQ